MHGKLLIPGASHFQNSSFFFPNYGFLNEYLIYVISKQVEKVMK